MHHRLKGSIYNYNNAINFMMIHCKNEGVKFNTMGVNFNTFPVFISDNTSWCYLTPGFGMKQFNSTLGVLNSLLKSLLAGNSIHVIYILNCLVRLIIARKDFII